MAAWRRSTPPSGGRSIVRATKIVYMGFVELESLLPEPEPEPDGDASPAAAVPATTSVRYPFLLEEPRYAPIPADLVEVLGRDGTQALLESGAELTDGEGYSTGDQWWSLGLPFLVKKLMDERGTQYTYTGRVEAEADQLRAAVKAMREAGVFFDEDEGSVYLRTHVHREYEEQIAKLQGELREAKVREEALLKAMSMMAGGAGSSSGRDGAA